MSSRTVTTTDAARILGVDVARVRRIMWAHGFDPVEDNPDGAKRVRPKWKRSQVEQVRQERIDWKIYDPRGKEHEDRPGFSYSRSDPAAPDAPFDPVFTRISEAPDQRPAIDRAERRARLTEELSAAPVQAADIDYLATRAGERRGRGARVSVTGEKLKEARSRLRRQQ